MAGLIGSIVVRLGISGLAAMLLCAIFSSLLTLGENALQSLVVLAIYIYCAVSLFAPSRHKLFYVLSIPVICQFLHLFQKYAFTPGANSIWRLLSFWILSAYLLHFAFTNSGKLSVNEKILLLSWISINVSFILKSPNLPGIFIGAPLLYLAVSPLTFSYLRALCGSDDFRVRLQMYCCLLYIVFGVGTFGLVWAGAGYKGSDNLLVTRNISDTNVTMAYFILLWPFALLYCKALRFQLIAAFLLASIFIGIVVISFSRGAAAIILPYLLISMTFLLSFRTVLFISILFFVLWLKSGEFSGFLEEQGLTYSWQLRMQDYEQSVSGYQRLQVSSGRAAIHEIAYDLFLESPAFGHGIGSFEVLGPGYREAHSLFYTWLAEEGMVGTIYKYALFALLFTSLLRPAKLRSELFLLPLALIFYLLFNHTVGSVLFIIPAKSLTINCFAPVLLLCLYFHAKSAQVQFTKDE